MELPAEIREIIFTYALALPPVEVRWTWSMEPQGLRVLASRETRGLEEECQGISAAVTAEFLPDHWFEENIDAWSLGITGDVRTLPRTFFDLLLVSKAFYKEALPCFYAQNLFYAQSERDLRELPDALPTTHLRHLQNIAVKCCKRGGYGVDDAFSRLARLPRLRELFIHATP